MAVNRRTLRQPAAQTMLLDMSKHETFIIDFATSVSQLRISNVFPGQFYVFAMKQNSSGGHAMNWGTATQNAASIDPAPNAVSVQCFVGGSGGNLFAVPSGTWS